MKDLVQLSDIKAINDKDRKFGSISINERDLLIQSNWSESDLQKASHRIIKNNPKFKDCVVFQQNDNGRNYDNPTKQDNAYEYSRKWRNALLGRKKQAAMGTQAGWKDVNIWAWNKNCSNLNLYENKGLEGYKPIKNFRKVFFVEFKKIGAPKPNKEQMYWHNFLLERGESSHFCNNLVYFEQIICKEIEEFLA